MEAEKKNHHQKGKKNKNHTTIIIRGDNRGETG